MRCTRCARTALPRSQKHAPLPSQRAGSPNALFEPPFRARVQRCQQDPPVKDAAGCEQSSAHTPWARAQLTHTLHLDTLSQQGPHSLSTRALPMHPTGLAYSYQTWSSVMGSNKSSASSSIWSSGSACAPVACRVTFPPHIRVHSRAHDTTRGAGRTCSAHTHFAQYARPACPEWLLRRQNKQNSWKLTYNPCTVL